MNPPATVCLTERGPGDGPHCPITELSKSVRSYPGLLPSSQLQNCMKPQPSPPLLLPCPPPALWSGLKLMCCDDCKSKPLTSFLPPPSPSGHTVTARSSHFTPSFSYTVQLINLQGSFARGRALLYVRPVCYFVRQLSASDKKLIFAEPLSKYPSFLLKD